MKTSARNVFHCVVTHVRRASLNVEVVLKVSGTHSIVAVITNDAATDLLIVKSSFVMLSRPDGYRISAVFAFEHAQSIAMTLPRLLTQAVKAQTGQDSARYVFPLGEWILEGVEGDQPVILTLKTEDGFKVSFRMPPGAVKSLGSSLQHEADQGAQTCRSGDEPSGSGNPELH
jgi:molybdopterin-binding protein